MANTEAELKNWHDWTDPDFFAERRVQETRFMPLFMRQLMPRHRQRTRLTLTGWFLILVSMSIGAAAYNTASNILFMTLSLLLSSLILSGILSLINFLKLEWSLHAPKHLKAGEVGMAEVELKNKKTVFPTMGLCFRVGEDAEHRLYMQHSLGAGQTTKLEWTFVPQKRGPFEVRISGVESEFPFGFLRKTLGANSVETVLVWPARIDFTFQSAPGGRRFLTGASRRSTGLGSDLLNLRPYQPGDAPRLVHWKATARLQKLMIRQLAQEGESGYHLVVDPDRSRWTEAQFESLCSVACSLADDLFHIGRLETATIEGQAPVAVRNLRDLHNFFDQLALAERTDVVPTNSIIRRSNRIRFRSLGADEIGIYIDENQSGQTHT